MPASASLSAVLLGPIEAGIACRRGRGELRLRILEMKADESCLVTGCSRNAIYMAARREGITVSVSPEGEGFRVWRKA